MMNIVVLISGNGSNLQALIDAIESNKLKNCCIKQVISNKENARGLERASKNNIPTKVINLEDFKTRELFNLELAAAVVSNSPDLVVLAGFMLILDGVCIKQINLKCEIINLHPALPNTFIGLGAIKKAYNAYRDKKITCTGVMVHKVIDKVDLGQPILVQKVYFKNEESLEDFEARMHNVEHTLIVEGVRMMINK